MTTAQMLSEDKLASIGAKFDAMMKAEDAGEPFTAIRAGHAGVALLSHISTLHSRIEELEKDVGDEEVEATIAELVEWPSQVNTDLAALIRRLARQVKEGREALSVLTDDLAEWQGRGCGGHCQAAPCRCCDGTGLIPGKGDLLQAEIDDLKERVESLAHKAQET